MAESIETTFPILMGVIWQAVKPAAVFRYICPNKDFEHILKCLSIINQERSEATNDVRYGGSGSADQYARAANQLQVIEKKEGQLAQLILKKLEIEEHKHIQRGLLTNLRPTLELQATNTLIISFTSEVGTTHARVYIDREYEK